MKQTSASEVWFRQFFCASSSQSSTGKQQCKTAALIAGFVGRDMLFSTDYKITLKPKQRARTWSASHKWSRPLPRADCETSWVKGQAGVSQIWKAKQCLCNFHSVTQAQICYLVLWVLNTHRADKKTHIHTFPAV